MRLISPTIRVVLGLPLALVVLAGIVAGCYWLSLVASLQGLEAGVREHDVIKPEKYNDWERVREQMRTDLQSFTMTEVLQEAKNGAPGRLASSIGTLLAGMVAPTIIDRFVDGFVGPLSLVHLLDRRFGSEQPQLTFAREGFTDLDEYTFLLGPFAVSSQPEQPKTPILSKTSTKTEPAHDVATPDPALAGSHSFNAYPVIGTYRGPPVLPDFGGRDRQFKHSRTRIRNGIMEGANFAGYKVVQFGCRTGCSFVVVADVSTGQVYSFPHGGEYDQGLQ